MRRFGAFVFLLLASTALADQPVAVLTAPATVPAGLPIILDGSKSTFDDAYACRWKVISGGAVTGASYDKGAKKGLIYIVQPPKAGTYVFVLVAEGKLADGTLDSDFAFATVVVGDPPPPPPPPTPPDPPAPDTLVQAVQAAYTAETDVGKAGKKDLLQSLYSVAASTTVNDASLKTVGDFFAKVLNARRALIQDTEMVQTRKAVDAYLGSKLPNQPGQALDQATKTLIGTEFQNVANALGKVK